MSVDDREPTGPGDLESEATVDPTPPAPASSRAAGGASAEAREPMVIGPYRLLHPVGEGGMGEVWLAEQTAPIRRQVALKIIKPGMDSKEIVARFEAERQALAMMNHPNVAKVFDAGVTPLGRPYFVMEYFAGTPIDQHCDRHRLTIRERLELFTQVCEGVQHAHQKAIIHRDLKPGNILVAELDGKRVPKIIDFGVAKATAQKLTETTMFTQMGALIGTPEYMSPEQADLGGEDIDTRTDVYSLGVILYELLVGALPFEPQELRRAGFEGVRRTIREEEPPRPSTRLTTLGEGSTLAARARQVDLSTLRRQLRGDLDWITMKALEKDRARRYASPLDLAADIQRHLADQPVLAGPPSAAYRLGKLVRRHRALFAAAAIVLLALVLGVAGSTWGLVRALRAERVAAAEAAEARRQAEIAEAVNAFLNQDLLAAVAPSSQSGRGIDVRMREVLDAAAQSIERESLPAGRFGDKPLVEAGIREMLGDTYMRLGEYDLALPQLERTVELRRRTLGENRVETARAVHDLGFVHFRKGDLERAERELQQALVFEPYANDRELATVSDWKTTLATVYESQARYPEAEQMFLEVLTFQRDALGADHGDTQRTLGSLANLYQQTGRYRESEDLNRQLVDIRTRTLGEEDPLTLTVMSNLANVMFDLGRHEESLELMLRVLELKRRILGPEHSHTLNSMNNIAETHEILGEWTEALRWHRETYEGRVRILGPDSPRTIQSLNRLALATAKAGDPAAALPLIRRSVEAHRRVRGAEHPETIEAERVLGVVLLDLGRLGEAETALRRAIAAPIATELDAEARAKAQASLGLVLAARDRRRDAAAVWAECVPGMWLGEQESVALAERAVAQLEAWDHDQPGLGYGESAAILREALANTAAPPS